MKHRIYRFAAAAVFMLSSGIAHAEGDAAKGEHLYKAYCVQCHGLKGDGKGVNAVTMEVQPRDHTDSKEMGARTDDDLFKAIKHGGVAVNKSILMPNWDENLTDDEIRDVIAYLRVLSGTKGK